MEPEFGIWKCHVGGGQGGGHVSRQGGGEWEWIQIGDEKALVVGTDRPTGRQYGQCMYALHLR
jgi:hypothetical protein